MFLSALTILTHITSMLRVGSLLKKHRSGPLEAHFPQFIPALFSLFMKFGVPPKGHWGDPPPMYPPWTLWDQLLAGLLLFFIYRRQTA